MTTEKWHSYESYVLENALIKVVIIPASNGRIAEYTFKPSNTNQFRRLQVSELEISPEFTMASANMAGYEDWIWEIGAATFAQRHAKYRCRVVDRTAARCSVQVSFQSEFGIERTIGITDNSTVVDVETKMTNLSQGTRAFSYWSHIMAQPGGAGVLKDVTISSAVASTKSDVRPGMDSVKSPTDGLFVCDTSIRKQFDIFLRSSQGWFAMANQRNQVALLSFVPLSELGENGFMYSNGSEDSSAQAGGYGVSMETIFQTKEMLAGEGATYHQSLASCRGIDQVVYADKNVVVGTPMEPGNGFKYLLSSPKVLHGCIAELSLIDAHGGPVSSAKSALLDLNPEKAQDVTFNVDSTKTAVGECERKMTVSSDGKVISEFVILQRVK